MWIRDTGEMEAVHIEGIKKQTVLEGFVKPFLAICKMLGDGKILNQINGRNLASTEVTTKKLHKKLAS